MGVSGLLPLVKKACRKGNLEEFKGRSLAVDVSFLLHRGVFGCAGEIANGTKTLFYVKYVQKHVNILLSAGCHVILVFDGQPLPAKKDITDSRRANREKNTRLGQELMKKGLNAEAYRAFQQAVTITNEIVENTIRAFKNVAMVDVIVAPYEADAQIAYLLQNELAYAAVTEDSDLIVFGCERIIFKLDLLGMCLVYDKSKLSSCVCFAIQRRFEFEIFRRICILAGCDYLQGGLQGVGLKKAELFFRKTTQTDLRVILPKLPMYLNMNNLKVDNVFIDEFEKAENTFLYQIVFDPINYQHTTLNPRPSIEGGDRNEFELTSCSFSSESYCDYAGKISASHEALRRALGNSNLTRSSALDEFVLSKNVPSWSIWSGQRFLEAQANKKLQQKSTIYEKLDASASKISPKKVQKVVSLNSSFPPIPFTPSSQNYIRSKRKIPLMDSEPDDKAENKENQNSQADKGIENSLSVYFRRKLLRRSEPMEVLERPNAATTITVHKQLACSSQQNGSTLKWNSNDWLKIYRGTTLSTQKTKLSKVTLSSSLEGAQKVVARPACVTSSSFPRVL